MDKNIVFISHGDIILDNIYDSDFNLIKQDGGGSNWNTLYNLAYMGENCYAIGSVGNDIEGELALNSLAHVNINTDYIIKENTRTNIMNILIPKSDLEDNSILHCWYSPITNKCTMHFSENLPITLPNELHNKSIFVLLDKFELINLEFINNIHSKKVCLDVGHIRYIEHFSTPYLFNFFSKANLMQINNNISNYLFNRFNVENEIEFFKLFNLDLLVLTMGKHGAKFIYKDENLVKCIQKSPEIIAKIVDSSGAGDAFLSTLIKQYAYYNKPINENFINNVFNLANKSSRDVISMVGSRRI